MEKIFAALALALLPIPAIGATFQVEVTGSLDFALTGVYETRSQSGFTLLGYLPIDDPQTSVFYPSILDFTGRGSVRIEAEGGIGRDSFSDCTGILMTLCFGSTYNFDETTGTAQSFSLDGGGTLQFGPLLGNSVGSYSFAIDVGLGPFGTVQYDGDYFGFDGSAAQGEPFYIGTFNGLVYPSSSQLVRADYSLSSYEISAVPLPASATLLLVGVGGLGFIARRRKKAA